MSPEFEDADVYICCAPEDTWFADGLCEALKEKGISDCLGSWAFAPEGAPVHLIAGSRAMVWLCSEHSNSSEQVREELEAAVREEVPILAARIDGAPPSGPIAALLAESPCLVFCLAPSQSSLEDYLREVALMASGVMLDGRRLMRQPQATSRPGGAMVELPEPGAAPRAEPTRRPPTPFEDLMTPLEAPEWEIEAEAPEGAMVEGDVDFSEPSAPEGAMLEGDTDFAAPAEDLLAEAQPEGAMREEDEELAAPAMPAEPSLPAPSPEGAVWEEDLLAPPEGAMIEGDEDLLVPAMPAEPPLAEEAPPPSAATEPSGGRVKIVILPPAGEKKYSAGVPVDAAAKQIVAKLVEMLKLPTTGPDGQPISYQLQQEASGIVLADDMTLAAAGVQDEDEVHLVTGAAVAAEASRTVDLVDLRLSAFHPKEVLAEEVQRLVAYAHLASANAEVASHALETLELDAEEVRAVSEAPSMPVDREAEIQVVPQVAGLQFSPSQQFLSLWEDWKAAEFRFRASAELAGSACNGSVMFLVEGILIAEVGISMFVRAADAEAVFGEEMTEASARPYRRVFPSHSHQDVEIVAGCEHYAALCGDEYLRDITTLRTGEQWSPRLLELIDEADVFQLFWSENAAASEYVEQEWRHAFRQERVGLFIRPIYWRQPMPDPPQDLAHIHFAFVELPEASG